MTETSAAPTLDPRTPVVVGVAQITQQLSGGFDAALEPIALMAQAVRDAAGDAGAPGLLAAIDRLAVVSGIWGYKNPGRLIAGLLGVPDTPAVLTFAGGNTPQSLVTDSAARIAAGELDVAVCVGGEVMYSRRKLREAGTDLARTVDDDAPEPTRWGKEIDMSSAFERSRGLEMPVQVYPMFETALAARHGHGVADHMVHVAELWEGLNQVAVANPRAWVRTPLTAEEIRTPGPTNRYISWPYTKAMNSNAFVDQAAAVILCSVATAESLGIARDRWVFPWSGADGMASPLVSERDRFDESPAIRLTGRLALELAGVGIDDIAHLDLYSCFPSVVQITMTELGIAADRQVTQTGGLTFFGGPMNNYVMHAIASVVEACRADGGLGLVHANGGYTTKQAVGVYGAEPPAQLFRNGSAQDAIDAGPTRVVDPEASGPAVLESYCVPFGADGPDRIVATALLPDGRRALLRSTDLDLAAAIMADEVTGGATVTVRPDGTFDAT